MYPVLLSHLDEYVRHDLGELSVRDPIDVVAYAGRSGTSTSTSMSMSNDDPLESMMYATSVGVPGPMYDTVLSLRRARSERCGALQSKLPDVHVHVLRLLGVIVLTTFPVCGSGSSAIAPNVLVLQSYMFGILAFGLTAVLGVVEELRDSTRRSGGAYGVDGALGVMVSGLVEELDERMDGEYCGGPMLKVACPGPPPAAVAARVGAVGGGSGDGEGFDGGGAGAVDDDDDDDGGAAGREERDDRGRAAIVYDGDGAHSSENALGPDAPGSNDNYARDDESHPSRRRGVRMWFRQKLSRG